jgi:Niemann-Pick C1 protein
LVIISNILEMYSVMSFWDISMNSVSLVNLLICLGISVEFCIHLSRAYMVMSPFGNVTNGVFSSSKDIRVFNALVETGSVVFRGMTVTKLLGIFVLSFAQSKIFEVFYFRMYLSIVVLGAFNGLFLLPILLSTLGPAHIIARGNNDGF